MERYVVPFVSRNPAFLTLWRQAGASPRARARPPAGRRAVIRGLLSVACCLSPAAADQLDHNGQLGIQSFCGGVASHSGLNRRPAPGRQQAVRPRRINIQRCGRPAPSLFWDPEHPYPGSRHGARSSQRCRIRTGTANGVTMANGDWLPGRVLSMSMDNVLVDVGGNPTPLPRDRCAVIRLSGARSQGAVRPLPGNNAAISPYEER